MGLSAMVVPGAVSKTGACLALIANRAYRIQPGARAVPLSDEVPVLMAPVYAPSTNEGSGQRLVEEAHLTAMAKPLTDVLVRGTARSLRGAAAAIDTGVRVSAARKAVRAVGDRHIVVGRDGRLSFSAAQPFAAMPLVWDRAYGGRDQHAEHQFAAHDRQSLFGKNTQTHPLGLAQVAYPRNAAGRGYYLDIDRARLEGKPAPNLEDPTDPVTPDRILSATTIDWIDRPVAACYEPIDVFTFPRATFLIRPAFDTPTRPVHELGTGAVFREDLDKKLDVRLPADRRLFNSAPAGLAVCRLDGTERVSLWNLHPRHELLEFDLPDDRPRLAIEPPGVRSRDLQPLLQTVLIEPDLDRVTLTWAGVLEVAMPYPEEMTRSMPHTVSWSRG